MENAGKRVFTDVIIPSYNCENTLESTVESIINSGLKSFDIILVDDGSTDKTPALCDALSEKYENFLCIHKKNGGVSSARNEGIRAAKGEYLLFFDSDDTAECGAFSEAEKILTEKSPDMLIFGMSFDYYKNGRLYRSDPLVYEKEGLLKKDELVGDFEELFNCNAMSPCWNKFYKKSVILKDLIRFNENLTIFEDFLFSTEALASSDGIFCLKEILYCYRQPEDEKNAFRRLQKIDCIADYLEPIEKALNNLGIKEPEKMVCKIYSMLLSQKLYYADCGEMKAAVERYSKSRLKSGAYEKYFESDAFLRDFKNKRLLKIRLSNIKTQLRHSVAVFIKSLIKR